MVFSLAARGVGLLLGILRLPCFSSSDTF
ncbi:hypothetical protein Gogos_018095, partial [Gossypium gossypioides]|nr:hypothetical protein [Gossypium gossypioides]